MLMEKLLKKRLFGSLMSPSVACFQGSAMAAMGGGLHCLKLTFALLDCAVRLCSCAHSLNYTNSI